ncbi:hypothetical protein JCM19274_2479 [Algibacter lectus]|uniref:Uncharacterized protein n=1 Tax=Algibacter lectus TaxID=221126 RepID=A0A090X0I0_9FLAO|nr:hypothetical protein JCM19274_2479 [Algibacter lectus]
MELADGKISEDVIAELSKELSESQYEFYKQCWKKYPKSKRRYSEFDLKDLNHPSVHYQIMDFFKSQPNSNYAGLSRQLLNLNETEFTELEKRKNQFENM